MRTIRLIVRIIFFQAPSNEQLTDLENILEAETNKITNNMKNFTSLFKKNANTPPVKIKGLRMRMIC